MEAATEDGTDQQDLSGSTQKQAYTAVSKEDRTSSDARIDVEYYSLYLSGGESQ